jgi:hypothetical protein
VEPDGDWPAVRAAARERMKLLGLSTARLARSTRLSQTTIRYFGVKPSAPSTLTQVNNALGFPAGHLLAVLRGESPGTEAEPDTFGKCVVRIERKLDQLLTLYSQAEGSAHVDRPAPPDALANRGQGVF